MYIWSRLQQRSSAQRGAQTDGVGQVQSPRRLRQAAKVAAKKRAHAQQLQCDLTRAELQFRGESFVQDRPSSPVAWHVGLERRPFLSGAIVRARIRRHPAQHSVGY